MGDPRAPAGPSAVSPARRPDVPLLADLMAASPLLRRYGLTRDAALAALEAARRRGDLLLLCRDADGSPVGLAWLIRSSILTGAAYLRLLLVAEHRQGAGIGRGLLAAAEASARAWANHLFLLVTADNSGARRFYERCGYRHVGDLPAFAVPGLDEALYQKALRPHGERLPV